MATRIFVAAFILVVDAFGLVLILVAIAQEAGEEQAPHALAANGFAASQDAGDVLALAAEFVGAVVGSCIGHGISLSVYAPRADRREADRAALG